MPFVIEAFTECRDSRLKVVALEAGGSQVEQAVCEVAINNVCNVYNITYHLLLHYSNH